MELKYIVEVTTWNSGGGIELNIVTLKDGRVLAISDESVVLYASIDDLVAGEPGIHQMIALS